MNFNSLGEFQFFLQGTIKRSVQQNFRKTLQHIAQDVKTEVKSSIGTLQKGIGPYPDWKPLAEATIERKTRMEEGMGGDPKTPLYARGDFLASVQSRVDTAHLAAHIGTNLERAAHIEYGTVTQPPRPVFAPSALRVMHTSILPAAQRAVSFGLCGVVISSRSFKGNSLYPRGIV